MGKARRLLPALVWMLFVNQAAVGQQPIHWEATIDSAQSAARQSNRLVLVLFSAPWCTACHHLENDLRNQPGAVAALEANFVPVKINYDYYPNTAKQFGVTRLPTTVILAAGARGNVLAVIPEYMPINQYLLKLDKVAVDARRPNAGVFAQIPVSPAVGSPAAFSPAADAPKTPPPIKRPVNPLLGLDGYCPVQLVENSRWQPGQRAWGAIHRGRTYLFAGAEERDRFLANPDRYAPVSSGDDVVLLLESGRSVSGYRAHGLQFDGHVYLFAAEATLEKFRSNPRYYADRALQALKQAPQTAGMR